MTIIKKISNKLLLASLVIITITGCTPDSQKVTDLILSSNQASASDTLVLKFPKRHPSRLAIKDPKGSYFIIHDETVTTHLISHKAYMQTTSLSLQISELTGITWIDGKRTDKQVFSVPGKYLIYMADNLETEPENTFYLMNAIIYK